MQSSTWFLNITVCIGLEVEWGTQNIFNHMYLEDILCLSIVVHGYVWYYAYLSMWKPANFHVVFFITVCIGLEVEWGTQNIFNRMYLEDILCLPIVVHGYVWYYPYISMWKHAIFHMVFEYYWLCRVCSRMGDAKYI
jgi:hypothetical protein